MVKPLESYFLSASGDLFRPWSNMLLRTPKEGKLMPVDSHSGFLVSIGTAFGAGVYKLVSWIVRRNFSEGAEIRKELRQEVTRLSDKMERMSSQIDHWRTKCYQLHDENMILKGELTILRVEVERLRALRVAERQPSAPTH